MSIVNRVRKLGDMTTMKWSIISALAVIVIATAWSSVYVVDVRESVLVTQFGRVVAQRTEPGLFFKLPYLQGVTRVDRRLREWDGEPSDLLTVDKENIEVNTWARWRVTDPLKFYEALRTDTAGLGVLDGQIDSSVKNVISVQALMEVLRNTQRRLKYSATELEDAEAAKNIEVKTGRDRVVKAILAQAMTGTEDRYGFRIEGMGIKHFNYVRDVIPKIYERMSSERIRIANRYESEGQERAATILGEMSAELERIESEGYQESTRIRGEVDATVIKLYAEAYGKDPEFYSFSRTLTVYPVSLGGGTRLVVSPDDSDLFRQLKSYGKPATTEDK
ncbi:MAG: HflC protein [Planctomycetes bacterium]|nr:HflC protein [Planctomycetota bacterium]